MYFKVLDDGKQVQNRDLMHDIRNDHAAVVFALESLAIRLRKNVPLNEWKPKFDHMLSVLLPHFDQEEKELFPKASALLEAAAMAQILEEIQKIH